MASIVPDIYEPVRYWQEREHPNTDKRPGISQEHADFFRREAVGAASVVEMGPGIGRLFPLYKGFERIDTVDLSTNYQAQATAAAEAAGISVNPHYLEAALQRYPFDDQTFDLGIASFVLLHVPFENIRATMAELARTCRKVLVMDGEDPRWPASENERLPSSHCFRHDHDAICSEIGCVKSPTVRFAGGSIGFTYALAEE